VRRPSRVWLVLAAYLVWIAMPGLPEIVRLTGANLGQVLTPTVAAFTLLRAARRRRLRVLWLLGAGCLAWALGNGVWTVLVLATGDLVPFPSAADLFYLPVVPLVALALLSLPHGASRAVGRLRLLCDSLTVAASLLAVGWPLVLRPIVHGGGGLLATVVSCAYPTGDLVLLALLLPMIGFAAPAWRPALLRLGAATLALTVSDVGFCIETRIGSYSSAALLTAGWVVAFCAFSAAGRAWPTTVTSLIADDSGTVARSRQLALGLAGYLPVLLAVGTSLGLLLAGRLDRVTGVATLTILVLVTIRQQLAFWENEALTRELESRVQQRTEQLSDLAYADQLTGLANRARFAERLEATRTTGIAPVVLLLDLDGFKTINDTLGHAAGDQLLGLVAARLRRSCPEAEVIARIGGDEFAIVLASSAVSDVTAVADLVLADLALPFRMGRAEARLGCSIGIAGLVTDSSLPYPHGDVLQHADLAMYAAKAAGRNCWRIFDPEMSRAAEQRRALEEDLRHALPNGQLALAFQPLIDLRTGGIVGGEALLRWRHPSHGLIRPDVFIPVAEETGMILPIGAWVLEQACRQAAEWKRSLPPGADFGIGVNLSVRQLQPEFIRSVADILAETGLSPAALVLEVTESVFMDDDGTYAELLQELRRLGPKIFLDDFGTGYSSLGYLRRFPVDGLKIDRSFVAGLRPGGEDVISDAIMRLAESLGLEVVAEGIEMPEQHEALLAIGCRLGQGFALGMPVDAATFTALLADAFPGCFPAPAVPDPRQALSRPATLR
jgi:diguanylate cyclase (GGDEF)-like protein